jgi:hypothetical protein
MNHSYAAKAVSVFGASTPQARIDSSIKLRDYERGHL